MISPASLISESNRVIGRPLESAITRSQNFDSRASFNEIRIFA